MKKISVIVPVYNVEKYLDKCIDSIVNQTYKNLEIILVDDGSPDGSPAICDSWAEKDSRINVIHKENGGVSAARNAGIDAATGDYIMFVDSDDYIEADMLEALYDIIASTDADIASCNLKYVNENGDVLKTDWYTEERTVSGRDNVFAAYLTDRLTCRGSVCKLYKYDVINRKTIRFPYEISVGEDSYFNFCVLSNAEKVVCTKGCYYNYLMRGDSAVHTLSEDFIDCWKLTRKYLNLVENESEIIKKTCIKRYCHDLLYSLTVLIKTNDKELINRHYGEIVCEIKKYKKEFLQYKELPVFKVRFIAAFPNAFRNIYSIYSRLKKDDDVW